MKRSGDERDEYVVLNPIEDDRVVLNGPSVTKAADGEPRVELNPPELDLKGMEKDLKRVMDELAGEWRKANNEQFHAKHLYTALRRLRESFAEADRYARLLVQKYQQQGDTPDGGASFKFPDSGDGKSAFRPRGPEDDVRTARNPANDEARERQGQLDAMPVDGVEDRRDFPIFGPSRRRAKKSMRSRLL
jgi:hypothetical protein